MRALALLVALVAADVCAASRPSRDVDRPDRPAPAFSLLPGGTGAGVSHVHTDLDRLFPAEMVGQWWALRGDGTTAGPLALSAVGSPQSQTDRVCPNGPDCAAVESRRFDGAQGYASASVAAPSGDFSCWVAARSDATTADRWLIGHDTEVAGGCGFLLDAFTLDRVGAFFKKSDCSGTTGVTSASSAHLVGAIQFWTVTYDATTDGASIGKLYLDGAQTGSTVSTLPLISGTSAWTVGMRSDSAGRFYSGNILAAGCTEKILSPTTIAAMASALLPSVQGSRGETVTTTRSTVRACCNEAGCSLLPANRACVTGATLDVSGQRTNLLQQSSAFDNAAWTKDGTPIVTANAAVAPDGTMTADQITVDGPANTTASIRQVVTGTAGAGYTPSISMKRVDTSGTISVANPGGSANGQMDVDLALLGSGWVRVKPSHPAVTVVNAFTFTSGGVGGMVLRTAASGAKTFYAVGAQVEAGSVATPYCPTTTSSAVCAADTVTVPVSDWPSSSGEMVLTYQPNGAGASGDRILLDARSSADEGWALYIDSAGKLSILGRAGGVGTAAQSSALTWTAGTTYRIRVQWSDTSDSVLRDKTAVVSAWRDDAPVISGATITGPGTLGTIARVGSSYVGSGASNANGLLTLTVSR